MKSRNRINFNPRSPHRERHGVAGAVPGRINQFQSTLPSQGATPYGIALCTTIVFQSTLPSQGATIQFFTPIRVFSDFNPRSPHRERRFRLCSMSRSFVFQSTLPSQGATTCPHLLHFISQFQSTLPSQGATNVRVAGFKDNVYFNPRSPHRERHEALMALPTEPKISIHAPLTGSDDICHIFFDDVFISIHAPLTGSDRPHTHSHGHIRHFNPRSPHRERLAAVKDYYERIRISIHAPLTGSDSKYAHKIPL